MATSFPPTVSFWMIPFEWIFACAPSFGFRLTRYGANAPGQTASIIATSIDDDFAENALTSWEYDASEAAGCGVTFTVIPVSLVNLVASSRSRVCPPPTESPTNVIVCPPYFALIAFALGTGGAVVAARDCAAVPCRVPAEATLSDTTRASAAANAVKTTSARCFMGLTSFLFWPHVVVISAPSSQMINWNAGARDLERGARLVRSSGFSGARPSRATSKCGRRG